MKEAHVMAEQDHSIHDWQWLSDLLTKPLWPIEGLIRQVSEVSEAPDWVLPLSALMDGVRKDLHVIADVLNKSFGGNIKVRINRSLPTYGLYDRADFLKAYIERPEPEKPQEAPSTPAPAPMNPAGGLIDDARERLDMIEALASLIMDNHCSVQEGDRGTCKLAVLIGELCDQADKMLEDLQVQPQSGV
jgi:hypothetical protein